MTVGQVGEAAAASLLMNKGWRVLDRNFRSQLGEIDLVVQQAGILAFIEVKTRTSDLFGEGYEAVTVRKRQKLYRLAEHYLLAKVIRYSSLRFDVISVRLHPQTMNVLAIEHWENAF
jgi:putative endonuclease